jgi:glycerol kinase
VWSDLKEISRTWSAAQSFRPAMACDKRQKLLQGWRKALERTLS